MQTSINYFSIFVNALFVIANYVLFLASDKAKGIIGQAAIIDGGYTTQ